MATFLPAPKRLSTMLLSLIFLLLTTLTKSECTNALLNPSFEAGSLTPWLDMATGSFSTRGLSPLTPHTGLSSYHLHSNSSTGVPSTLTLSQSYITLPDPIGATVSCWAWLTSSRPLGQTRVEMFLDAESCGEAVWMGETRGEWVRVGGEAVVRGVSGGGVGHTVVVSVQGSGISGEGWSVGVDDVGVGGGGC